MYKGDQKPTEISEDEYRALYKSEEAEDVTPNKAKHDAAFGRYEQQQKKESPLERILRKRKTRREFRG